MSKKSTPVQVYLIPGFLGFGSLGAFSYFRRVPELLKQLLSERGLRDVVITECPTLPSGSIARRARLALERIVAHGGTSARSVHLIGHSTGGLDARLLATPGVRLLPGPIEEEVGRLVRSVITLSTPHFGTPMANLLLALPFRRVLETIGLLGASQRGQGVVVAAARILEYVSRLDDWMGRTDTFLEVVPRG